MSPARMERVEAAVRAALALNDAWNKGDFPALEALLENDCCLVTAYPAPAGERFNGKASILEYWRREHLREGRPLRSVKEIYGVGNHAVLQWAQISSSAEHSSLPLLGVDLVKVRMGGIVEIVSYCKGGENPGPGIPAAESSRE